MQTDSHDLIELISKERLLLDLAMTRYGDNSQPIGVSTFYRWAKQLGLSASKTHYSGCEKDLFHDHAKKLRIEQLNRRPPRRNQNGNSISKRLRQQLPTASA